MLQQQCGRKARKGIDESNEDLKRKAPEDPDRVDPEPQRQRRNEIRVGHLGDSNMKIITMNQDIEATVWKYRSEGLIRFNSGMPIRQMDELSTRTFEKAEGMIIAGGGREIHYGFDEEKKYWTKLKAEDQQQRLQNAAKYMNEVIEKYRKLGKKVVYIAPHLRKYSFDNQEAKYTEICEQLFHPDVKIINTTRLQLEEIEEVGNREEALNDQILHDGTHLRTGLATIFYKEAVETFGWRLEPKDSGKDAIKYHLKEALKKKGRCIKCGSSRCTRNSGCNEKVFCKDCKTDHHSERMCPSQVRPCFHCGDNKAHNRKPCQQEW